MAKKSSIKDFDQHPWKCFLLDQQNYSVYGMLTENEHGIGYQWLGNKGDGKFYVMSTHWENKRWFKNKDFEIVTDYETAYNFLIKR